MTSSAGTAFAEALAAKDHERMREILAPELDFKGLTPRRNWEASTPDQLVSDVLSAWFDADDRIEDLERVETDTVADLERVGYRLAIDNPEGASWSSSRRTSGRMPKVASTTCASSARASGRSTEAGGQ